jgi:hypothetical protein
MQLDLTLTAPAVKVGSRVARYCWQVIAVDARGEGHGTCGHAHSSAGFATMCPWEPAGWDAMTVCDLLVREVRA